MILASVKLRLGIWLYILSSTVLLLLYRPSAKLGRGSHTRALSSVDSLSVVPRAAHGRGTRWPMDLLPGYGSVPRCLSLPRNVTARDKLAAALGCERETVRTTGLSDNGDGRAVPEWLFDRLLRPTSGSRTSLEGGRTESDIMQAKLDECPSELLKRSLVQVKHAEHGPWPHFTVALASGDRARRWRLASREWQKRGRVFGVNVYTLEAGGGGDCMYFAIAAALQDVAPQLPHLQGLNAQTVRNAAAVAFIGGRNVLDGQATQEERDRFLQNLGILVALEDARSWPDKWSPRAIMTQDEYTNSRGGKMATNTLEGKARALFFELSRRGTSHLGTDMDLGPLQDQLNVGFIVLNDQGILYPIATRTDITRAAYALLYFYPAGHFQVAGIGTTPKNVRSSFRPHEVPDFLHCVHIVDARSPVCPTAQKELVYTFE